MSANIIKNFNNKAGMSRLYRISPWLFAACISAAWLVTGLLDWSLNAGIVIVGGSFPTAIHLCRRKLNLV